MFVDLTKAFDTVGHKHLMESLQRVKVDQACRDLIADQYKDASTQFQVNKELTSSLLILLGVKQGDPLSLVLFNIAMDAMLDKLCSYDWCFSIANHRKLCAMSFADDLGLDSPQELQPMMELVLSFCIGHGMKLNVAKCAAFSMHPGSKNSYLINDPHQWDNWTIGDQVVPSGQN